MIERAIIFSEGEVIESKDLNIPHFDVTTNFYDSEGNDIVRLEDLEKLHIKKILNSCEWNRENTARALGISQKTLYSKIKKYSIR